MYTLDQVEQRLRVSADDLLAALPALNLHEQETWTDDEVSRIADYIRRSRQASAQQSQYSAPRATSQDLQQVLPAGIGGNSKVATLAGAKMAAEFTANILRGYGETMVATLNGQYHPDPEIAAMQEEAFGAMQGVNDLMQKVFFGSSPDITEQLPALPVPNQPLLPGQQ